MVGRMIPLTRSELDAVVRWLEQRHEMLHLEQRGIESHDDFTNGQWPKLQTLRSEQIALHNCIRVAKDQITETTDDE